MLRSSPRGRGLGEDLAARACCSANLAVAKPAPGRGRDLRRLLCTEARCPPQRRLPSRSQLGPQRPRSSRGVRRCPAAASRPAASAPGHPGLRVSVGVRSSEVPCVGAHQLGCDSNDGRLTRWTCERGGPEPPPAPWAVGDPGARGSLRDGGGTEDRAPGLRSWCPTSCRVWRRGVSGARTRRGRDGRLGPPDRHSLAALCAGRVVLRGCAIVPRRVSAGWWGRPGLAAAVPCVTCGEPHGPAMAPMEVALPLRSEGGFRDSLVLLWRDVQGLRPDICHRRGCLPLHGRACRPQCQWCPPQAAGIHPPCLRGALGGGTATIAMSTQASTHCGRHWFVFTFP